MVLYRLEIDGWGVFCRILMKYSDDGLFADYGFSCDRRYQRNGDWRSACESIDKLIEYFGSDFAYCLDRGASIVEYVVHKAHVRFGLRDESIEVVFNPSKAKERNIVFEGSYKREKPKPFVIKSGGFDFGAITIYPSEVQ